MAVTNKINAISTVSQDEEKKIISTFMSMTNKNLNCLHCASSYKDEKRKQKYRENRGCFGIVKNKVAQWSYSGSDSRYAFYICPTNLRENYYSYLINSYREYESGTNFFNCGKMEQPYKFVQIMEIISSLFYTKDENQRKELERFNSGRK